MIFSEKPVSTFRDHALGTAISTAANRELVKNLAAVAETAGNPSE
jgi:hypothetical protein